jgi:hypothetical protein
MSQFEILTLVVSCLAVILSVHTLWEQRKLQREANELQRVTAELAKRQLEQLEEQDAARNRAYLAVDLYKQGNSHRLRVSNVGNVDALNIRLELEVPQNSESPLAKEEYAQKFPVKRLNIGGSVSLLCGIYLDSPPCIEGVLFWSNPDGTEAREEFTAYVP